VRVVPGPSLCPVSSGVDTYASIVAALKGGPARARRLVLTGPPPAPQRRSSSWALHVAGGGRSGGLWCTSGRACPACRGPWQQRPGRRRRTRGYGGRAAGAVPGAGPRAWLLWGVGVPEPPRPGAAGSGAPGGNVGYGLVVRADRGRDWRAARPEGPRLIRATG